jgi:hypothetical protein
VNTTYLEMLESHQNSYNCDMTLFTSGDTGTCHHCDNIWDNRIISPSLDELIKEEHRDSTELVNMYHVMENRSKTTIYITETTLSVFKSKLEECLSYKKFEDIKRVIFAHRDYQIIYKRLLTPKIKEHLKNIRVPYKHMSLKIVWEEFLGVKPI